LSFVGKFEHTVGIKITLAGVRIQTTHFKGEFLAAKLFDEKIK
jgi:hypothetical protein